MTGGITVNVEYNESQICGLPELQCHSSEWRNLNEERCLGERNDVMKYCALNMDLDSSSYSASLCNSIYISLGRDVWG